MISYDRLIMNCRVDYYISFDNEQVGEAPGHSAGRQAQEDGKPKGPIVMINGAPTDNNAKLFKQGAHSVLDTSGVKIAKEYDTPDWSADKAQNEMEQAITALGKDGFVGVYAANDGTAGGAIAAMKGAGIDPTTRPTTGQDAELAGDPADPRRRAVHDGLQGDQAGGREGGRDRRRAGARAKRPTDLVTSEDRQRPERRCRR